MKVKEAYPNGKAALSELENDSVQSLHPSNQKLPTDVLENTKLTSTPNISSKRKQITR